jgi:uncharacterized membrane protein
VFALVATRAPLLSVRCVLVGALAIHVVVLLGADELCHDNTIAILVLIAVRANAGSKLDARVVLVLVSMGARLFRRLPAFPAELLVTMVAPAVIE